MGREEVRSAYHKATATMKGFELLWEPQQVFMSPAGEMAYVIGTTLTKMPGTEPKNGKFTSIYAKRDGEWKAVLETRNYNA